MYILIKYVHVVSVVLSVTGFFLRGLLIIRASPLMNARWIKVLPHINDTILLAAAVSLAVMSEQYPFVVSWITAKVLGVTAYIILGSLALREGSTRRMRIVCWLAALAVFGWIVSVALTRQPTGFLAALV
ncbi:MAG: regulator SirB [Rhodocyclales bacterium GWA2_65_19]|nr:MAG: regulator SirB [Rhodocyclales bacterium GWA2_65_19]